MYPLRTVMRRVLRGLAVLLALTLVPFPLDGTRFSAFTSVEVDAGARRYGSSCGVVHSPLVLGVIAAPLPRGAVAMDMLWDDATAFFNTSSATRGARSLRWAACKPVVLYSLSPGTSPSREVLPSLSEVYGHRRIQRQPLQLSEQDEKSAGDSVTASSGAVFRRMSCSSLQRPASLSEYKSGAFVEMGKWVRASRTAGVGGNRSSPVAWASAVSRSGRTGGDISSISSLLRLQRAGYVTNQTDITLSAQAPSMDAIGGYINIDSSSVPIVLLVEPSGSIGFGATLSSLLLFGVFNVGLTGLYVDGVLLKSTDFTRESDYAIRVASIPASPAQPPSSLLWFNGAETLSGAADQDCDDFAATPVNITFVYLAGNESSSYGTYRTTVLLDGNDGRPLLVRRCTFTPLLLSLSTSVRVMEPMAAHVFRGRSNPSLVGEESGSGAPQAWPRTGVSSPLQPPQRLNFIAHPQFRRVAGQPQQDWEARIRRFSVQNAPFSFSDVDLAVGIPRTAGGRRVGNATWWDNHSAQAVSYIAAKDRTFSNVSILWSVGEITGDLTTATVLRSLDVPQESYGMYAVLPSLTRVAHTVTLPAIRSLGPGSGLWFWNQDWMVSTTYYDVYITGAFPRSTLFVNLDTAVVLRRLRTPALRDGDAYASVVTDVEECVVSGAADGDTLRCRVAVANGVYEASDDEATASQDLLQSCGGGVVAELFLAYVSTAADAAAAVVDGFPATTTPALNITAVVESPVTVASNSVLRLGTVLSAAPGAETLLRRAAAVAEAGGGDAWVLLRFSTIYQNRWSGSYQVHCDGSAEDMQLSIRTSDDPSAPVLAHCMESPAVAKSAFRHAVVDTVFDSQSALYINASCAFRLATLLDADATSAAFCGVALEGVDVDFYGVDGALLPSYAVYELLIPVNTTAQNATALLTAPGPAYRANLTVDGAAAPLALLDLPLLTSDAECYGLPWRVTESAAAHAGAASYGQRWGGLGYDHQTFPVTAKDGVRYCHAFVAFALAESVAALCPQLRLTIHTTAAEALSAAQAQRVFCGSRSIFMDPISALQLRVPLAEVPRMVDLDAVIPDTESGYMIYQYCVDVLFSVSDADGMTGAFAQNGPLVFTLLDTVDTPSGFVPWVRHSVPDATTPLVLGDTLYFAGEALRYYDAGGEDFLTGTRFSVSLAEVDVEACGDYFLVVPSGYFPVLQAQWVNASTVALPITADVPGGWFNFTMSQGEAGDVYVSCGLSFRVASSITSVTTADVAGPSGGTVVRIRGANLPMATPGSNVTATLGYTRGEPGLQAQPCVISSSLGTEMTCTTPRMSAETIAQLAIVSEETDFAYTYWLPLNVTSRYYNVSSGSWELLQSLNADSVDNAVLLLSVKFRVTKMTVTDVWPLDVSRLESNPSFTIKGVNMEAHSVLLCDVATITPTSTPDTTSCILCLPQSFSSEEMVCNALWPLNESAYRVYVSDVALDGDTGFIVHTHFFVTSVQPAFLYPYSEDVALTIEGGWFVFSTTMRILLVAQLTGGSAEQLYSVIWQELTNTTIVVQAPDLSWMAESGGTLAVHIFYGLDTLSTVDACQHCTIPVVPKSMMPSIESIRPFAGQAPMLIHVYGTGFTKLYHSPKQPLSLTTRIINFMDGSTVDLGVYDETYISIGVEPCTIVEMLNTLIVCNLTEPCANLDADSSVRLVSRSYGSTSAAAVDTSSKLFFYCTMALVSISYDSGSTAGGQEVTVEGIGFPSDVSQVTVSVAGIPCTVTTASKTAITCITAAAPAGRATTGIVTVSSTANGRESSCCSYTYDPDITPTITAVSPTEAAAGAQLLLFGTNFPFTEFEAEAKERWSVRPWMEVLFGQNVLEVTAIESETRASVTIPQQFFGRDYLTVHVPGVGNSAPYLDHVLTVLMTPTAVEPSIGGFRGQSPISLVGTYVGAGFSSLTVSELFEIFVCGRLCEMMDSNDKGEAMCRVPTYMDEEMVARHRALLPFPPVTDGFDVYVWSVAVAPASTVVETASPLSAAAWTDVSVFFGIFYSVVDFAPFGSVTSTVSAVTIASPEFSILLKARLHSRLLLYNVMLFLDPVANASSQLDLSNATCRLALSTAEAETAELFTDGAQPNNASMWATPESSVAWLFAWPSLQIGANSLNFNALDTLPTAAYVRVTCEGFPVQALRLRELTVNGYQVGLEAAGGRCPVNMYAQRRRDQLRMNSCASRTGVSCPMFTYRTALTPVVTHYSPAYVLASDVGARVVLYGSGFGTDISGVRSIILDKARCTPESVQDEVLVCRMEGRVSVDGEWSVLWQDEWGRGEAMLLSAQPFYAAVAWSSYLAWRGEGLPKEGQIVVIPRYNTILLDTTPPALTGLLLYGVLIISDEVDIELRLGLLAIAEKGALIAGSVEEPHQHRFTITLATNYFQDLPLYYVDDITSISSQAEPYLDKTLEVLGGTLQLHGMPPTVTTARLAATAHAGDSVVTLSQWVPWRVGESVALVTKDDDNPHHVEWRVIARRVANATHTDLYFDIDAPLLYRHAGDNDAIPLQQQQKQQGGASYAQEYARSVGTDVVYLTRTICIRGDATSAVSGIGASLWLVNTTTSQLSHVEMYRTGKRGSKSTYSVWLQGIHFPANRVVLDDIVVYDAYFRGVVLQATRHVVVRQLTVLAVDGFGIASIGASDERVTIEKSLIAGLYGDSGGIDTVAAGLFISSADVTLHGSEVCVSAGHGVWFALRFLYVSATARTCPGQSGVATFSANRIHHITGHGILIYPLHFNAGDRCPLSANTAAANDPVEVAAAAMRASVAFTTALQTAGTLKDQLIFSCGLHGVYLPPSSGYVLQDIAVMDCTLAALFIDYATNTTVVRRTFVSASLPDGTCSASGNAAMHPMPRDGEESSRSRSNSNSGSVAGVVRDCGAAGQSGLQAQHGGHLSLFSIIIGDFCNGSAVSLATLSAPSSRATTYPSGSFAALRSAHLTARVFNFSVVGNVRARMLLAGVVAVKDVDGQMTMSNAGVFLLYGGPTLRELPPNCFTVTSAEDVEDAGARGGRTPSDSAIWSRGREVRLIGVNGKKVVRLVPAAAESGGVGGDGSSSNSSSEASSSSGDAGLFVAAVPNATVCVAPLKHLSLLFVHVTHVDAATEGGAAVQCAAVTAELRERDNASFVLTTGMSPSSLATPSDAASATSFYILTQNDDDDDAAAKLLGSAAAHAAWQEATPTTESDAGGSGYYTLVSSTNITLAFRTAAGSPCYPAGLSLSFDPSLLWPTSQLLVRTRVSPSASYFERHSSLLSTCATSPLMGCVVWTDDHIRDDALAQEALSWQRDSPAGVTISPSYSLKTSTVMVSLATNPACTTTSASTAAMAGGGNAVVTPSGGPWSTSASLWAAVDIASCSTAEDSEGVGCMGPYFPYLRRWVPPGEAAEDGGVSSSSATADPAAPSSYVSWYSATAWGSGFAPWNIDLNDKPPETSNDTFPTWYEDAYIILLGTRVNLTLTEAVQVNGTLVVAGELLITAAPTATSGSNFAEGENGAYEVRITTLIVLGKLTVLANVEGAPLVRIVLGADSERADAYRLDVNTLVYPGTLYAAGEVALVGSTAVPTTWKTATMVRRGSTALPALVSMTDAKHMGEWCAWQARWAVAAAMVKVNITVANTTDDVTDMLMYLNDGAAECTAWMRTFQPSWTRRFLPGSSAQTVADVIVGLRRGDRVGLTSGGSSLDEAEERVVTLDVAGLRVMAAELSSKALANTNVTTGSHASGAVSEQWSWSHGRDGVRDASQRLPHFEVGSEAVRLTKTLEFDCAIPRTTGGTGCLLLITRQLHPSSLFEAPRFHARGVSIRHFGKGGQLRRDGAAPASGVAPLTFVPAIYVNVSANLTDTGASALDMDSFGYAALIGCVVEASYGTALYTDQRSIRLFVVDSAVWFSEGGGVRLDGGGPGVFMESLVVAGTRYSRAAASTTVLSGLRSNAAPSPYEPEALSPADGEVTSLCSFLLNDSHLQVPLVEGYHNIDDVIVFVVRSAPSGAYIKNVVAAGSESEGFCLPWAGSGGSHLVANNTAHSSYVGLFLFHNSLPAAAATVAHNAYFPLSFTVFAHAIRNVTYTCSLAVTLDATNTTRMSRMRRNVVNTRTWTTSFYLDNPATFDQWVLHSNRYIGVYSSSHQNVTIRNSDIFANPIGVALAIHPSASSGRSEVADSYIATFPRCSCTAAMYTNTSFDSDDGAFWQVCQPSVFVTPAWTPQGCGAVTFIDRGYHYAAVLALPSYTYVPLSYNRSAAITAPTGNVLEAETEGMLLLNNVLFGAVGDLRLCESNACDPAALSVTGRALRSAAVMGTAGGGLRSSASLSPIEMQGTRYAPSSAPALVSPPNTFARAGGVKNPMQPSSSGNTSSNSSSSTYRALAGTPVSVIRLRPTAAITPTSPAGLALAELDQRIRSFCASGAICTASNSAAVATLRDGYASPYSSTVVIDVDGSAFGTLSSPRAYVVRDASATAAESKIPSALCSLSPLTSNNMFACAIEVALNQVRLYSGDNRVSPDVAVPLLFTRTSVLVAGTDGGGTASQTPPVVLTTPAVLQPPRGSPAAASQPPSTIIDAALLSSGGQLSFRVPQGMVVLDIDPMSYPEALELRVAACSSSAISSSAVTHIVLPLLDESASVRVWDVSTQTPLGTGSMGSSSFVATIETDAETDMWGQISSVFWPTFVDVVQPLSKNTTLWLTTTAQDNDNGVTASSLLFQITCGTRLRVHQLVYATVVLYTTDNADPVNQRVLRYGVDLTVDQLLPPEYSAKVNTSEYNDRLRITVSDIAPDPNTGTGVSLTIKVQAVDSFAYNITDATLLVSKFSQIFSAAFTVGVDEDAGAGAASNDDGSTAPASAGLSTLTIADVQFRVLLVIPPLLPSERHYMQTALSRINVVKRGSVSTGSLVALATVVPAVVLLVVLLGVVQFVIPVLRHRGVITAAPRQKSTSMLDVTTSTLLREAVPYGTAAGGRDAFRRAVVVWFAGLLPTTLGATLDKAGVTRGAAETVEALQGGGGSVAALSGTKPARPDRNSSKGAAGKIVRQLFLLPSYNVLSGTSSTGATATPPPAAASLPLPREQRRVVRVTDPQRSLEADRQRYVDDWRIGTRVMTHLTQHGVNVAARLAGAGRDAARAGGLPPLHGTWSANPQLSSTTAIAQPDRRERRSSPSPWWYRGMPDSATTSSGHVASETEHMRHGGTAAANAAPPSTSLAEAARASPAVVEHVIPVNLSPSPFFATGTATDYFVDRGLWASGNTNTSVSSVSTATPTPARHEPPLPPLATPAAPSASGDATAASLQALGGTPMAIQSILTTSILAGNSLAYPAPLVHVPGSAAGGRVRDAANPSFGSGNAAGGTSDDLPLVLRGRGNISFATPDADLEATRALRGAASAAPPASPRSATEDTGS